MCALETRNADIVSFLKVASATGLEETFTPVDTDDFILQNRVSLMRGEALRAARRGSNKWPVEHPASLTKEGLAHFNIGKENVGKLHGV